MGVKRGFLCVAPHLARPVLTSALRAPIAKRGEVVFFERQRFLHPRRGTGCFGFVKSLLGDRGIEFGRDAVFLWEDGEVRDRLALR